MRPCFLRHDANRWPCRSAPYHCCTPVRRLRFSRIALLASFLIPAISLVSAQHPVSPASPLPDAPLPVIKHENSKSGPCRVIPKSESAGIALSETGTGFIARSIAGIPTAAACAPATNAGSHKHWNDPRAVRTSSLPPDASHQLLSALHQRTGSQTAYAQRKSPPRRQERPRPLQRRHHPRQRGHLQGRFRLAFRLWAEHCTEFAGWSASVGEDMTGRFFGTFLIPSIVHQDPALPPHAPPPFRLASSMLRRPGPLDPGRQRQRGMAELRRPGRLPHRPRNRQPLRPRRKNKPSTPPQDAYAFGLALAPTDNFITEFLPDLARRIHVRVVLVQQIINQVAHTEP